MALPALPAQYRARELLGSGAMGDVYLVDNVVDGRVEALKVLRADELPEARGRFKREARAAHRLDHQNIVPTYTYGELPDGRLYLTMEYVVGPSLAALLHQRGPLSIAMTLGIIAELADAIHHAHAAGVIHRDLKPANLILADHPNGKIVRVLDFGMAKILEAGVHETFLLSQLGAVFGTPAYMAPEQCQGLPPDPRTDIYAAGCVVYELLVGEPRVSRLDARPARIARQQTAASAQPGRPGRFPARM